MSAKKELISKDMEKKRKSRPTESIKETRNFKKWLFFFQKASKIKLAFFNELKYGLSTRKTKSAIFQLKLKCDSLAFDIKNFSTELENDGEAESKIWDEDLTDTHAKFAPVIDELTASYIDYLRSYNQTLTDKYQSLLKSQQ